MHLRYLVVTLCISGPALVCDRADAQGPDSLPFHRGQWGAEFNVAGGFVGAGALRFTGPAHAWLVDLGTSYLHNSTSGTGGSASGGAGFVTARLGTRSYHALGNRLDRATTFGVLFTYARQSSGGTTVQSVGTGLFGDLGAHWFVTPHLGLGARWGITLAYAHGRATGGGGAVNNDSFTISLGTVALTGQLVF